MNADLDPNSGITAFPLGLANRSGFSLWAPPSEIGAADAGLHKSYETPNTAMWMETLDSLVEKGVPAPTKLKIDVDGFEPEILSAGKNLLGHPRLQSVMVEVDESNIKSMSEVLRIMSASGFEEPQTRHAPYFDENHYLPFSNYLFVKP